MCGIAGAVGVKISTEVREHMLQTMRRRGPDGNGYYESRDVLILHARLAIIDPAGGAQPMSCKYAGETYIISYNGELYNTEDLRRELVRCGHEFQGHSDTEVLLHAYCQWGAGVLEKLNGIFAFAVWKVKERSLFLARDRMGVKPLFYSTNKKRLIFASEIKTILASKEICPALDETGISELILLGPGRTPGSGVFKDILELEPGCCAQYQDGKLSIRRYWRLEDRPHTDSLEETVEKVRWLVTDSIQRQMISDVPIGTFLSGGLDSSLITAICANSRPEPLPTFSVDYLHNEQFFVPGKFQPNADSEFISIMQESLGTEQHLSVLTPEQLVGALEEATCARDLPGMADVDFSLFAFCEEIRAYVKVALSGECADEIFGGYPWYRDPEIRSRAGFPWAQNTLDRCSLFSLDSRHCLEFVEERYLETIRQADILPENSPTDRRTKEMVNLNMRWFMQTLLDRKDRMSMYHGLEVRVPFCDHRVAEYLYTVPWELKDYHGQEKGLLRTAMSGVLPDKVLWRKKSPYPKTFDPRYEELVRNALDELFDRKDSPLFAFIRCDSLQAFLAEEKQWPWYGQLMRRPQTIAYFLQLDFWLRKYNVNLLI